MTQPDRPVFVKQLDGSRYAGLNCTCAAGAMALDRHTIGAKKTNGATVRMYCRNDDGTPDVTGGTRLTQVADALERRWDISLTVRLGETFDYFAEQIRQGRGAILQGWAGVTKGTKWQASESFAGNHAWYVNDHNDDGYLVYDPLADGRRAGIATSPMRIPKSVVMEFAGRLNVASSGYRALGHGRIYAAFTRDTEPHAHFHPRAWKTKPFPDRVRFDENRVAVFAEPDGDSKVIRRQNNGELFVAFQQTENFLGSHNGKAWVRKRQMRRIGGST